MALPAETKSILVVNPDGVLAGPIGFECVEFVIGWNAQVAKFGHAIQDAEFAEGGAMNGRRKFGRLPTAPDGLGGVAGEALITTAQLRQWLFASSANRGRIYGGY